MPSGHYPPGCSAEDVENAYGKDFNERLCAACQKWPGVCVVTIREPMQPQTTIRFCWDCMTEVRQVIERTLR